MEGTTLRSRYNLIRKLGSGGFGDTYLARDLDWPGKPLCVVKHLQQKDPKVFPIAKNLFEREAETLSKLGEHPQIPRLMAYFEENGQFCLVQEFIDGHDLTEEIIPEKPLTEEQTIFLLREILEVLSFVHQEKIIHRDLKPANVMRRKDGKIFLIDFGAVKEIGTLVFNSVTKQTGVTVAVGSPGYMPNEQANGKPKLASDVYAVGMIALEALTGLPASQIPQDEETEEFLWRPHTSGVSDNLAKIIDKMIAGYAPNRYKNATEALNALKYTPTIYPEPTPSPVNPTSPKTTANQTSAHNNYPPTSYPEPTPSPDKSTSKTVLESKSNNNPTNTFECVIVDNSGTIVTRFTRKAEYFTANLGNGVIMDFVLIPGGSFIMGSPSTEKGRCDNEGPQHEVTLKPFLMGKYPVNQTQYEQLMGKNPSVLKNPNFPVDKITWDDAVDFCQRLSQKIGKTCSLPSEAQWEYAARAGSTTPFCFGATLTSDLANYNGTLIYANEPTGYFINTTTEVGRYSPNAFGLYDIHGNVWEWCQDSYHKNYQNAPNDGSAWINQKDKHKIIRGGSWEDQPSSCRSAYRTFTANHHRFNGLGFRVVC